MFEIDKKKFGAFVAKLRKEKGYTQKELAERLFISDKAVSKWETGSSIPDTPLLIPLANILSVSVTELLTCEQRINEVTLEGAKLPAEETPERAYQHKSMWLVWYIMSFLTGSVELFLCYDSRQPLEVLLPLFFLCALFGGYFCFFVKTKLPLFYDKYPVTIYYDGPFRMNMSGIEFNNHNWLHIVKTLRMWMCFSMIGLPIFYFLLYRIGLKYWSDVIILAIFFCSLFLPVYTVRKKYA